MADDIGHGASPLKSVWADDCVQYPFWLEGMPEPEAAADVDMPSHVDVAIIGSGYTGLNAAIETARGGRSTLVLDAGAAGQGCSTRNGGQISTSVKPSFSELAKRHGVDRARAVRNEGQAALDWIGERIARENIDCDFRCCGRFHAAHTPQAYAMLCRQADALARDDGIEAHPLPQNEQRRELGTDVYHGGLVFPHHAALHPAKYHYGLLTAAQKAGANIVEHCAVLAVEKDKDAFLLKTAKGMVRAHDVVVATNGYTGVALPWLRRRVIPIGSYMIATEPLPEALVDQLFPTDRIASDTCKVVYYYRASPDRRRVLFGGRVSASETDTTLSGPRLHADMCRIFPELRPYRISHSWMGTVAYTFDEVAHIGVHDGIHYAMGYCGSGVSMASYLGMRLGRKVLGQAEGRTGFDDLPFPTRPLYTGKPWFLPPLVAYYRWRDRKQHEAAKAEA